MAVRPGHQAEALLSGLLSPLPGLLLVAIALRRLLAQAVAVSPVQNIHDIAPLTAGCHVHSGAIGLATHLVDGVDVCLRLHELESHGLVARRGR